jgi:hypothetical protein
VKFQTNRAKNNNTVSLSRGADIVGTTMRLPLGAALAEQGPPGCNWKK